jgi:hypothetical protein
MRSASLTMVAVTGRAMCRWISQAHVLHHLDRVLAGPAAPQGEGARGVDGVAQLAQVLRLVPELLRQELPEERLGHGAPAAVPAADEQDVLSHQELVDHLVGDHPLAEEPVAARVDLHHRGGLFDDRGAGVDHPVDAPVE